MKWIKGHKLITFFLGIIIISLGVLIFSVLTSGSGTYISQGVGSVFSVIEKPIGHVSKAISKNVSGIFSYKNLQEENQRLSEENEKLRQQVTNLTLSANELSELKKLSKSLNYSGIKGSSDIVSADVISVDGTNWMNVFTIGCGTESGIQEGNIVICGEGLVGRVSAVGNGWAKVVSIIDQSSKISFKVSGNLQLTGIVEGATDGVLNGFMLDNNTKISEGDKLITSGMGIYPAGIEIGKVIRVKYDSDSQLQRVTVKASVNFTLLQKVTVIV